MVLYFSPLMPSVLAWVALFVPPCLGFVHQAWGLPLLILLKRLSGRSLLNIEERKQVLFEQSPQALLGQLPFQQGPLPQRSFRRFFRLRQFFRLRRFFRLNLYAFQLQPPQFFQPLFPPFQFVVCSAAGGRQLKQAGLPFELVVQSGHGISLRMKETA